MDASITSVSRTSPTAEAREALEACQIGDDQMDQIIGMGLVPRGRDLPRYINISGTEPEIDSDSPAWAITLRGEVPQPTSHEVWIDPTCVIIDGEQGYFATGGGYKVLESGKRGPFIPPLETTPGPDLALPPLAP